MIRHMQLLITTACLGLLLGTATAEHGLEKWSRQLESTGPGDTFDWVPLAQPVDGSSKERGGRVLTYSQTYPSNPRFGDLPTTHNSPVQQQQQTFDFPYQFQKYASVPQAQPLRQQTANAPLKSGGPHSQEPTSQSFFKFEMPFHGGESNRHVGGGSPTLQTGYQIQHTFGGGAHATLFNSPLFSQFPPEFHPIQQKPQHHHLQQKPLHHQNFIEDPLPSKNTFKESKPIPTQQALQTVTPQVFPVDPQPETVFELNKPASFQSQLPFQQTPTAPPSEQAPITSTAQQQEVQLLYVPYDTLYNQQQLQGPTTQNPQFEVNKYNINSGLPAVNPYQINQFYTQEPFAQEPSFFSTSTTSRPHTTSAKPTNIFQNYPNQQFTTAKPKPKAHQPPLAMFILRSTARPTQSDVVAALRNANTIAVIDSPTKNIPEIFVGPGGMPIPNGFVKFDLPYLSQLSQARDLHDVPFFVAPLSYRTPNGFNKILLPEPHVGSIVINRAKDHTLQSNPQPDYQRQPVQPPQPPQNVVYSTPVQNDIQQQQIPTQRPRLHTHRVKKPSSPKTYYPEQHEQQYEISQKNRNPFEITTQRATLQPSRGNKFSYFYDQDGIQEVTSPKVSKQDRPKKKRPQNVQVEQPTFTQTISNPYAQFNPMPNQIINDDYYKVHTSKPTTTSTSSTTSTSTSTTSTTPVPPTFFSYKTSPQVEFHSTSGQLYHDFSVPQKTSPETHVPRFTTRPPPATSADEEFRMKQYFRQQDAFRNRPQIVNQENPPYEQVQYTPVSLDYDREVNIPSTTHRTTTTKQRVTYYTPTEATPNIQEEDFNTVPPREITVEYNNRGNDIPAEPQTDKNLPSNHRPSYNHNEVLDGTVDYDPNPYQLPSELPPLTPNLPGLVNGLLDKDKQNNIELSATTPTYEQEQPTRPTRRPINRVRKPVVSKVTSSVSYSESESSSKRPSHRIKRPYGSRGTASSTDSWDSDGPSTTTRRPSVTRNPLLRNPNRIRYQPTPEERQTLRLKPRKQYTGSKKNSASEDLEYQRDVLKQNYPVFRPATPRKPTSPTAIPSSYAVTNTEEPISETQQVYTVTPSNNNIDGEQTQSFPGGLLEPMQIAKQYHEYSKDNYGPGYFPNQEDLNPTEAINRNEINPVYNTIPSSTSTTTTTTTEIIPVVTTRRSPFIRRNYPRLRTTTEAPITTTQPPEERQSVRPRLPPRKVIKVRARTRRPLLHPASSTALPEEEEYVEPEPKNNYRKLSRFNKDLYENDSPRRRYKPQFQLDGQESQWSPSVKTATSNNFKPVNPKEARNDNQQKFDNDQEIVTAESVESDGSQKNSETYEVNVSANLASSQTGAKATLKEPNLKPEKSFAELLEEVMGKAPEEAPAELEVVTSKTTDGTFFESQKTTINNRLNRRGKWKKLRTSTAHNNESFETAESQNIGTQLFNSLYSSGQEKSTSDLVQDLKTTTPMTPAITTTTRAVTTTPAPTTTVEEYDMTTPKQFEVTTILTTLPMDDTPSTDERKTIATGEQQSAVEETATRRLDEEDLSNSEDLETQPSLFSEVKKQLHDLFSIEENEDEAVTAALAAVGRRRQEYTNIKRTKPEPTSTASLADVTSATESSAVDDSKKEFHKNLMDHVVYATSTSTKVTSETEICYRGRCIRSEDLPPNHKLN